MDYEMTNYVESSNSNRLSFGSLWDHTMNCQSIRFCSQQYFYPTNVRAFNVVSTWQEWQCYVVFRCL